MHAPRDPQRFSEVLDIDSPLRPDMLHPRVADIEGQTLAPS
jgi:hypothetical protein